MHWAGNLYSFSRCCTLIGRLHGEGDGVDATGQLYYPKKTANYSTRQNGDVLSGTESKTPLYAPESYIKAW